jgi:hypothetical protein
MNSDLFDNDRTYFDIEIKGNTSETEIWLGDDAGHLVQKEVGALQSSLIPGDYVVEFGLGTTCYPIHLNENSHYTQSEIEAGPSCERPSVRFTDSDE